MESPKGFDIESISIGELFKRLKILHVIGVITVLIGMLIGTFKLGMLFQENKDNVKINTLTNKLEKSL